MYRFERELESLRKELAEAMSRSERSSPTLGPQSDDDLSSVAASSGLNSKVVSPGVSAVELPLETVPVIPGVNGGANENGDGRANGNGAALLNRTKGDGDGSSVSTSTGASEFSSSTSTENGETRKDR